jgi:hypothetical protein
VTTINHALRYFGLGKYMILNEESGGMLHLGKWEDNRKFNLATVHTMINFSTTVTCQLPAETA